MKHSDKPAKLAVLFPGIGYTCDKPLLYYTGKYLKNLDYEVIPVPYKNFPKGVKGNQEKMQKAFKIALAQAEEILSCVDFKSYEEILFVSKSIGTVVASSYAVKHKIKAKSVLFTPLKETYDFTDKIDGAHCRTSEVAVKHGEQTIAFHGTKDPWADTDEIIKLSEKQQIPLYLYEGCNHSLECGDIDEDIHNLGNIMKKVKEFICDAE